MSNQTSTPTTSTAPDIATRSDLLQTRCEKWSNTVYRDANEQLYGLLAEAFQLYCDIFASEKLRREFRDHLVVREVNFRRSTPLATRVIRFLFSAKQGRGAVWGKVLELARKAGMTPAQLPAWIVEAGGVEEIAVRRGKTAPQAESADVTFAAVHFDRASAVRSLGKLPDTLLPDKETDYPNLSLALIRSNGGIGEVVWGTGNASAVAKVLELAGKDLRKKKTLAVEAEQLQAAEDSTTNAIRNAAQAFQNHKSDLATTI